MKGSDSYVMLKLAGQEFTFSTDVSKLPCGLNGALYFVEMQQDGGKNAYPLAEAAAQWLKSAGSTSRRARCSTIRRQNSQA
jgi:cellulose 1,4-beta-cellobiosidase